MNDLDIKKIREKDQNVPVIFTSARDQDLDKITNYYQTLTSIQIVNGYAKNNTLWENNNRVKKIKMVEEMIVV